MSQQHVFIAAKPQLFGALQCQTRLLWPDLPHTYLAHHELSSIIIMSIDVRPFGHHHVYHVHHVKAQTAMLLICTTTCCC